MSSVERVSPGMLGWKTAGHEVRYALAAGLLRPGDVVVDAACGIGYGALILDAHDDVTYFGVDRDTSVVAVKAHARRTFIEADLQTWQPSFAFDVAVGFETIEHLADYEVYLRWVRQARRYVVVSVPIVPTKHENVFHAHDFERDDVIRLMTGDSDWRLFQYFDQPWEKSCVYVFARPGVSPIDPGSFRRRGLARRALGKGMRTWRSGHSRLFGRQRD